MPTRMRLRWTVYAGLSTALAGGVILKALAQRPNFYSATVYLSQSSANLMILTNLIFVAACTFLLGLQKLLFGPLRPIETEQLYEKAWFAITETCLAMTIFRGEIGAWFLIMFFALLAGKVWGWIGEGRVETLEQQPPRNPRLFHTRLALSLGLSVAFDMTMLEYVVKQVMRMARPDMTVMFGFEFAVLSLTSLSTAARYAINLVEIGIVREQKRKRIDEMQKQRIDTAKQDLQAAERRALQPETEVTSEGAEHEPSQPEASSQPSLEEAREALVRAEQPVDENEVEVEGWEGKGRWVFYLDLATDFFKLVVYLSFFVILLVFYGLPIHIIRDVFLTARSFFKRISDFVKYRTATRDMNARYPDATSDDIGREDVCIICREEMRPYQPVVDGQQQQTNPVVERMRPKKLPCGHVLHFACLRSWLERQQLCPTCRRPVLQSAQATTAAAGQAGAQGAQGQHPAGEQQGPRVFQFGPLRIGVGAARGNNMFEELQQQLGEGQGQAQPRAGQNGPQQYGFGIRWDGRRRHQRRHQSGTTSEQLNAIGRQLQEESRTLLQNTQEYRVLQNLSAELERIRAERNTTGQSATGTATQTSAPVTSAQPQMPPFRTVTNMHPVPGEQILQAGSENLPAGLTLPEGWSMVPLQPSGPPVTQLPIPQAHGHIPMPAPFATSGPVPGGGQFFQGHWNFQPPTQVPEHVRAMFSGMPGQPHQHHQTPNIAQNQAAPTGSGNSAASPPISGPGNQLPIGGPTDIFNLMRQMNASANEHVTPGGPVNMNGNAQPQGSTGVAASTVTTSHAHPNESTTTTQPHPLQDQVQPQTQTNAVYVNGDGSSQVVHNNSPLQHQHDVQAQRPLPSWGSPSAAQPPDNADISQPSSDAREHDSPMNGFQPESTSESSTDRKPKPASVEDLVEAPD